MEETSHPWEPVNLFQLQKDTTGICPAGDWFDIRGHVVGLYWLARNICWRDPRMTAPMRPPLVVEIGTREGPSTLAFLQAMREAGGKLISIECDEAAAGVTASVVEKHCLRPWWEIVIGRSEEVHGDIPGEIDVLMIDGDHGHDQVKLDCDLYTPKVRVGGLALFHDYYSDVDCQRVPVAEPYPSYASIPVEGLRASGRWEVVVLPWSFGLAICRKIY